MTPAEKPRCECRWSPNHAKGSGPGCKYWEYSPVVAAEARCAYRINDVDVCGTTEDQHEGIRHSFTPVVVAEAEDAKHESQKRFNLTLWPADKFKFDRWAIGDELQEAIIAIASAEHDAQMIVDALNAAHPYEGGLHEAFNDETF